jgi:hypothetical protein
MSNTGRLPPSHIDYYQRLALSYTCSRHASRTIFGTQAPRCKGGSIEPTTTIQDINLLESETSSPRCKGWSQDINTPRGGWAPAMVGLCMAIRLVSSELLLTYQCLVRQGQLHCTPDIPTGELPFSSCYFCMHTHCHSCEVCL